MSILLSVTGFDPHRWRSALRDAAPDRTIILQPEGAADPSIRHAIVWKQPPGILAALPNLRAIFSLGAGVDHILKDDTLPDCPIVRIVDPDLTGRMSEYVVWRVLDHLRRGVTYRAAQAEKRWVDLDQPAAHQVTVGLMGLGALGRDAAEKLKPLGFRLVGWSRSGSPVEGVEVFGGSEGLEPFLARTDIVVVLLPLTPETRGIVGSQLLDGLKRHTPLGGPVLINAGRGGLQDEAAILAALDRGRLMEASLDVFEVEPLPETSPFWTHPKVFVTPHAAALSDPGALAPAVMAQIAAHERGEPLRNLVDRRAGY